MSRAWLLNPYLAQKWQTGFTSCAYFRRGWLSTALCWGRLWSLPGLNEKAPDDWSELCATKTRLTTMHFFFFFFCQCGFHYIISCSQIKITVPFLPWNVLPSYLHGMFSYVLKFTQTTLPTRPLLVSQSKFPRPFPFKTFHILSVLFIFSALALTTISYLFCLPVSSIRT